MRRAVNHEQAYRKRSTDDGCNDQVMEGPKLSMEALDALIEWANGKEPLDEPIRAALIDALSELRVRKTLV
jgi:hypothetical protein